MSYKQITLIWKTCLRGNISANVYFYIKQHFQCHIANEVCTSKIRHSYTSHTFLQIKTSFNQHLLLTTLYKHSAHFICQLNWVQKKLFQTFYSKWTVEQTVGHKSLRYICILNCSYACLHSGTNNRRWCNHICHSLGFAWRQHSVSKGALCWLGSCFSHGLRRLHPLLLWWREAIAPFSSSLLFSSLQHSGCLHKHLSQHPSRL